MKINFWISNWGGSPLQVGLERGLKELGHDVSYDIGPFADLTILFNQSAHIPNYVYPDKFPAGKIAFLDCAEYGYFKRLPAVAKEYQNTFSPGAMKHDTKNEAQQKRLFEYLNGKCFPYFMREYIKFLDWPSSYYPIDYPLYQLSVCHERPDKREYMNRKGRDLWTSWGLSHPWRVNLVEQIRRSKYNVEILNVEEAGRMPQGESFDKIRESKCSVSFDGYGSSSFRLTEVIVRTVLLRGPLSIKMRNDLSPDVHCIDFNIVSDGENFISTDICDKIEEVVLNPERSYTIYEAGYYYCMEHYTEKATAQYFLDTVEAHNYTQPTQLIL